MKAYSIEELFYNLADYLNLHNDGKFVVSVVEVPQPSNSFWRIIQNINFARKIKGDIVHVTGDVHYLIPFLPKKAKKILTIHDLVALKRMNRYSIKYLIIKYFWYILPFQVANKVTVISESTFNELQDIVEDKNHKTQIIENFVKPIFKFSPKVFSADKPVFLLVGGGAHKNTLRSIWALKSIPGARVNLLGNFDQSAFDLLDQFGLEYAHYTNLPHIEVVNLYVNSDIVLFPSLYEGFGMPIIEGQSVGRPVITSNLSPMKEIAGDSDCFVDPESVTSIELKIRQILSDESFRNSLIEKGLNNVKRFSISRVAEQYLRTYSA